ncbi:DNA helicase [Gordonia phage Sapo]|nr:DNA helicase [Gordonia phage Sapo]
MSELRPYQHEGVEFLEREGRAYLGDEMGLGKSAQLVRAADGGNTLVVAPATLVDSGNWEREVERWAAEPEGFVFAPYSGLTLREKTGKGGTRPTSDLHPHLDRHWDTLVLDEAHYVKNEKAFRTKAVAKLAKQADQVFLASGTPVPNWPHELLVPLRLLYPEEGKPGGEFGSRWRWTDQWFKTRPSKFGGDYAYDVLGLRGCTPACGERSPLDPCEHYLEFARENFGDKFLQRLRDDVLTDLPPLTVQEVKLPFTPKQDREYASLKKDYFATVGDEEVVAWSDSAKNSYLDKLTTGLGLLTGRPDVADSNKFDQLREDLEQRYRPTLVAGHYRLTVEAAALVSRSLGKTTAVVHGGSNPRERRDAVEGFQEGRYQVLCGSLDTVAEGLTLTAADLLVQLETSYKPSRNQQVKRRIHRLGQERPCLVREYVSTRRNGARCLDENKRELVDSKVDAQTRTLSAARFKELL